MPWSSSARSQRRLVAPRRLRSMRGPHVGVGGVDAHVERRQPLGDHPLEVGLGEAGQRGEVPVEERQPVVVVLQVQAAAQARRQLVDEAELAVVVAGADLVEQRPSAPRRRAARPRRLATSTVELEPAPATSSSRSASSASSWYWMTSRGASPLMATTSSPGCSPARVGRRSGRDGDDPGQRTWRPGYGIGPAGSLRVPDGTSTRCCSPRRGASAPAWRWPSRRWPGWCGPSSRPCTATTRSSTTSSWSTASRTSAWCSSTTSPRCRQGAPLMLSAHGSAPEVVAAARADGRLRGRRRVPAGHQGPPRGEGAGRQGLPDRLRRPRGPRGGGRHHGRRPRRHPPGRDGRRRRRAARRPTGPVALLAQTTLSHHDWAGVLDAARDRFPDLWMPGRSDLCFATTNRQSALMAIAPRCDAVVVIGSANSSNTVALEKAGPGAGLRAGATGSTAPTSCPTTSPAPSASPPAPRRPRSWSTRSSPASRPADGVEEVARHRRGRVLPAAPRAARAAGRHRRRRHRDPGRRRSAARPWPATASRRASDVLAALA